MIQQHEFHREVLEFCNGLLDQPPPQPAPVSPCYLISLWCERHINVTLGWGIPWQEIHKLVAQWWELNGHLFPQPKSMAIVVQVVEASPVEWGLEINGQPIRTWFKSLFYSPERPTKDNPHIQNAIRIYVGDAIWNRNDLDIIEIL